MSSTAQSIAALNDQQLLNAAYRNNAEAVALANELRNVSHVIDDLVDQDKPVAGDVAFAAFWSTLVELPANRFYMEHLTSLHPLVVAALTNWRIANTFERGGLEDRHMAHSLRYDLGTVLVMVAYLIGGREWAETFGPEIRRRCQKQPLADYLGELEKRFPAHPGGAAKHVKGGTK